MAIVFPSSWVAGEKVKPSKLNGFFQAISSKFSAGITSADISQQANITGSQISKGSGSRIGTDNIEDSAIKTAKLFSDGGIGRPGSAVTTSTIAGAAVDSVALAALSVTKAKLNVAIYTNVASTLFSNATIVAGGALTQTLGPTTPGVAITWDSTINFPLFIWQRATGGGWSNALQGKLLFYFVQGSTASVGSLGVSNLTGSNIDLTSITLNMMYIT